MSKNQLSSELASITIGVVTSVSVGTMFLHALSAFALALIGGCGGWVFQHMIRPKLDAWRMSYLAKKNEKKA